MGFLNDAARVTSRSTRLLGFRLRAWMPGCGFNTPHSSPSLTSPGRTPNRSAAWRPHEVAAESGRPRRRRSSRRPERATVTRLRRSPDGTRRFIARLLLADPLFVRRDPRGLALSVLPHEGLSVAFHRHGLAVLRGSLRNTPSPWRWARTRAGRRGGHGRPPRARRPGGLGRPPTGQ